MDLLDESGEIRATAFNEQVDKFMDMIEVSVYGIKISLFFFFFSYGIHDLHVLFVTLTPSSINRLTRCISSVDAHSKQPTNSTPTSIMIMR